MLTVMVGLLGSGNRITWRPFFKRYSLIPSTLVISLGSSVAKAVKVASATSEPVNLPTLLHHPLRIDPPC